MTQNEQMVKSVKDWLLKGGFPLEMKTASAFREAGFEVRQSVNYIDPDTKKLRWSRLFGQFLLFLKWKFLFSV